MPFLVWDSSQERTVRELDRALVVIGRDALCDVVLDDVTVSRRHALVQVEEDVKVTDLRSTAGTRINGAKLKPDVPCTLEPGDFLQGGRIVLSFHAVAPPPVPPSLPLARRSQPRVASIGIGLAFICQMLHEYMGYFYDYGKVPAGGGIYVLEQPGFSLKTRDVLQGRLANGNFTTLALSADARLIYFAFAESAERKPDYYSPDRRSFHLFSVAPDGSNLRQLTQGLEDDFDPCPLPDAGVAFMSTRRGGFARCNNPWEPCASYTLHRMDADGQNLRILSVHETSEWHPSVMNDGRLIRSPPPLNSFPLPDTPCHA